MLAKLKPIARLSRTAFLCLGAAGAASAADAPVTTLPTVSVQAGQETAAGPVQGYVAKRSATGTKTDTAIIETPQSITVIGAEEIETLKAQNINDAIAYSVGAARTPYMERTGDEVRLRGFVIPMSFRDGSRYQGNRFDGQQEAYGLERIEVLRGAASILYGAAEPGGVVNAVSKRPTAESLHEINLELGSFKRKQVSGDFGGALSEDGAWTYRLTGLKRDSDTSIDYVQDKRGYIAPALAWRIDSATSLTLLAEYQRDRSAYGGDGLPAAGTVAPNSNGRIPRERFGGEPGYDHFDVDRYSFGYLIEHAFSEQLKLRHSLRRYGMDQDWAAISLPFGLEDDQRTVAERYMQERDEQSNSVTTDTSLQYDWRAGGVAHTSLVGLDYSDREWATLRREGTAGPLDLYAPVYGGKLGPVEPGLSRRTDTRQLGLYVQDQMKFADKWVLLLGGRYDRVRQKECDYFVRTSCDVGNDRSTALTKRAGLVYLAANGLAPFASFSQSFAPMTGVDLYGNRFKPTRGEQFETGLRYQPSATSLMLSAAIYQLTQSNVLTDDPANPRNMVQRGEVRSRGAELEAKGRIGRNLQIIASYSYTDARTTKASPLYPEEQDKHDVTVPRNQFSLWGDYGLGDVGARGFKLGGGVRYVDDSGSPWHDMTAPQYTVFDAMASYTTGSWRLALNVTNVADKPFITSCPYRCFYGEPRKAIGTVTYRW